MAQKKKGGFFSSLGQAVDSMATSIDKATKDVSKDFDKAAGGVTRDVDVAVRGVSKDLVNTVASPLDNLKVGFIVSIAARSTNSLLKVASNGMVDCSGALKQPPDMECQFEVIGPAGAQPTAIRLRSVAYPQFYLAIVNGFFIGYGQGGPECDFTPRTYSDTSSPTIAPWCVFESVMAPGSHIGVIPTGQFSAPGQTPKTSNAAHFKVSYVGATQAQGQAQSGQAPPPPQYYPPHQPESYPCPPPQYQEKPSAPPPN